MAHVKRRQKSRLTRRVARMYQHILCNDTEWWSWRTPGMWRKSREEMRQLAALIFAKEWGSREGVDLKRLEGMVARGPSPSLSVRFASEVPGANVRRIARAVAASGDPAAIKAMMRVPGVHPKTLENALIVAEVMSG